MRGSLIFALAVAPTVAVALPSLPFIAKRQLGGYDTATWLQPNRILSAQAQVRANAKRSIIRWGPFHLPAANDTDAPRIDGEGSIIGGMDPYGYILTKVLHSGICEDCTVLAGKTDITHEDGSRASVETGIYTHHILLFDQTKRPPDFAAFCPGPLGPSATLYNPFGNTFLGGAVDEFTTYYTTPDGQFDSGYYLKNNTFLMQAEVVNYKNVSQPVYITMDYEYVPGRLAREAMSTLLTVTGCSMRPGFRPTVPKINVTSGNFAVTGDGWIINSWGHLHDGGVMMQLRLNGKSVCNSTATYGGKGGVMKLDGQEWDTISSMSNCAQVMPVKRGDYLSMSAIYDTTLHPLRESMGEKMEEMGIFFFSFVANDTGKSDDSAVH